MSTVKRFDVGSFGNIEKTPSGGFRVPAFFTRAGVFSYKKDDGTVQKELRPEEEVFKQDSLASLKGAPITYLHPESPVNPDNWNEVTIGHVGDSVERQDYKVAGIAYIQAKSGIEKIEKVLGKIQLVMNVVLIMSPVFIQSLDLMM